MLITTRLSKTCLMRNKQNTGSGSDHNQRREEKSGFNDFLKWIWLRISFKKQVQWAVSQHTFRLFSFMLACPTEQDRKLQHMNPVVLYNWLASFSSTSWIQDYHRVSRQWVHDMAARKHPAKAGLRMGKDQPIETPFHLLQWGELKHMLFNLEKVPCLEDSGGVHL